MTGAILYTPEKTAKTVKSQAVTASGVTKKNMIPTVSIADTQESEPSPKANMIPTVNVATESDSQSSNAIPTVNITSNDPTVPVIKKRPVKKAIRGVKLRGADKVERIPIKVVPTEKLPKKPDWVRVKLASPEEVKRIKGKLREQKLHTVCEEAACPNLPECFGGGTATFMIMGAICTRRCPFCDVAHGKPNKLDELEPLHTAETIAGLGLKYAVITSVDRDDLRDGGAQHFVDCINESRRLSPKTLIEILVPDFIYRTDLALDILTKTAPDVFNHNIETVPRLYKAMRPGSDYQHSLDLLRRYKEMRPDIVTKCGFMVGLGETEEEVIELLNDLREAKVDLITVGQYLQPSKSHAPVKRFVHPDEFERYTAHGKKLGFKNIWAAPMVRSSYFADRQYNGEPVPATKRGKNPTPEHEVKPVKIA